MKYLISLASIIAVVFPVFTSAETGLPGLGGALAGEPCLVPVYHTDFAFPPEGGQIVQSGGGQMFFVRTYLPGCANAGAGYTPIPAQSANTFPQATPVLGGSSTGSYSAPVTGCSN